MSSKFLSFEMGGLEGLKFGNVCWEWAGFKDSRLEMGELKGLKLGNGWV